MDDREKIFNEIKETEKRYLDNLHILNKLYLQPIQRSAKALGMVLTSDLKNIISTLTIILNINTQLSTNLQATNKDDVGSVFMKVLPFLKTYTSYFNSYEGASNDIRNQKRSNKKFADWLDKTEKTAKKNGQLGFISYLIQPIQRVPRYSLLLNELLKNTDASHKDYTKLKQSLEKTKEVAAHLDRAIEEMDNRAKMANIQRNLMTNDGSYQKEAIVAPHRKFIYDLEAFVLTSQVTATQQEEQENGLSLNDDSVDASTRFLFLFSDVLIITRKSTKVEQMGYKSKKELRDKSDRNSIRKSQFFQNSGHRSSNADEDFGSDGGIGPIYVVLDKILLTQTPLAYASASKDFNEFKLFNKQYPNMFQISTDGQTWSFFTKDETKRDKFIDKFSEGIQTLARNPNYKLEDKPNAQHQGYPEEVETFCITLIQNVILTVFAGEEFKYYAEQGSVLKLTPRRAAAEESTDGYQPRHLINSVILSEYDSKNEQWVDLSQGSVNLETNPAEVSSFRFRFIDFETQKEVLMVMTAEHPINVDEEQLFHTWYIGEKYYALQVPNLKTSKRLEKFYKAETEPKEQVKEVPDTAPVEEDRETLASADKIVLLQHDVKAVEWKIIATGKLALYKLPNNEDQLTLEFIDVKTSEKRSAILQDGKLPSVDRNTLLHTWNEQQALFEDKLEIAVKFSTAETSKEFADLYDKIRRVQVKDEVEETVVEEAVSNIERSVTEVEPEENVSPVIETKTEESAEEELQRQAEEEERIRLEKEREEQERQENEKLEREREDKEKLEKERLEQERLEQEKKEKEAQESKQKEDLEREQREREEKEKEEKEKQAKLAKEEEERKRREEQLKQLRAKEPQKHVQKVEEVQPAVQSSPRSETAKQNTEEPSPRTSEDNIPEWKRRILEKKRNLSMSSSTLQDAADEEINVEGLAPWQIEILKKRKTLSAKVLTPNILSSASSKNLKETTDSTTDSPSRNINQLRNKFETGV